MTPHADPAERRRSLVETLALAGALHAYILFWRPRLAVDFGAIALTLLACTALFRRRGETLASLGICFPLKCPYVTSVPTGTRTGAAAFRAAARLLTPLVLAVVLGSSAIRAAHGPAGPHDEPVFPGLLISVATYPLWGFLQQLFYLGFVMRGLARGGVPVRAAGAIAGAAYGLVHAPNWPLVAATLPLGLTFAAVYARAPSLLAIGIAHGIAGAFGHEVLGLDFEVGARFGE